MSTPEERPPVKVKLEASNVLGAGLGAGCLFAILAFLGAAALVVLSNGGAVLSNLMAHGEGLLGLLGAFAATALIVLAVRFWRAWRHSKRP